MLSRRFTLTGVPVLVALMILGLPIAASAAKWSWKGRIIPDRGEEPIRTNKTVRLGAYMWVFDGWSDEQRLRFAGTQFDIFSYDHGFYYTPESTKVLRSYNPAICLMVTFCPMILDQANHTWLNVGGWNESRMESWVLRTKDGAEAANPLWSFGNTRVMDIGNPDWAIYFRDRANMWVDYMGADGYFIDGVPWNGVYYPSVSNLSGYRSVQEINDAIIRFLDLARTPHHCLVVDDVFQPWQQAHLDGVWGEDWLAYDSSLPFGENNVARWEQAVQNLETYTAEKKPYIAQGWYHYGNSTELEYLVATYLLGKKSNSGTFQPCPMGSPALSPDAPYDLSSYQADIYSLELEEHASIFGVELGMPVADRVRVGPDFWVRQFTNGLVYVNPSLTRTTVFEVDGSMRNVEGEVVSQVTLGPRSGAILLGPEPVSVPLLDAVSVEVQGLKDLIAAAEAIGANVTYYRAVADQLGSDYPEEVRSNLSGLLHTISEAKATVTRLKAEAYVAAAERAIARAKELGIDTTRHELFMARARELFQQGNYASAELMCAYPLTLMEQIDEGLGLGLLLFLLPWVRRGLSSC